MPLVVFEMREGRSPAEIKTLLDAAHRATISAFKVPERDRYQIVHENKAHNMIIKDTGLPLKRSAKCVVARVFTSPRPAEQKQAYYAALCRELEAACGLSPDDVMVAIMSNEQGDWSFGRGAAQYLTGDLQAAAAFGR